MVALTSAKAIGGPRDARKMTNADNEINHGKTYTELDKFGLFLKANSALIGCSQEIQIPFADRRTDHEVELAVFIGRTAKRVSRAARSTTFWDIASDST